MQARHRHENLLRAMELAKLDGQPYVPYDAEELREITGHEALQHFPLMPPDVAVPGWKFHLMTGENMDYAEFVEHLGYLIDNPSHQTVGVMLDGLRFVIYTKE